MCGRLLWGWIKWHNEELHRLQRVLNEEGHLLWTDVTISDPTIHKRRWGGVSFVYSFGDCKQLPPVMQKAFYDTSAGAAATSDLAGKIAVHDFLRLFSVGRA